MQVLNDEELRYVKGIHRPRPLETGETWDPAGWGGFPDRLFPPSAERKQLAAEVLPASKASPPSVKVQLQDVTSTKSIQELQLQLRYKL